MGTLKIPIEGVEAMSTNSFCHVKRIILLLLFATSACNSQVHHSGAITFEDHISTNVPSTTEIDVFLNNNTWGQFDPELGYILGNYLPRNGVNGSSTLSTVQSNGARTSFIYSDRPCRINTYGNSFTLCQQSSDGESWQDYLSAHFGEPIRNFGMGGFGVYQAYRRMIREEMTEVGADYVILYIWGDDHIRSLLRCRYMLTSDWNRRKILEEGPGRMFCGNFWPNIEMNLETGQMVEHENRLSTPEALYKMSDSDWMYKNLKDDLALQMALYANNKIVDIDTEKIKALSNHLLGKSNLSKEELSTESVAELLDKYSFAATKYILNKAKVFAEDNNKKLMIVLFCPYRALTELIQSGTRYDQEIVDYLTLNNYTYFDMNLAHVNDYSKFNLNMEEYFQRYFIGHYNPGGNHFFAFSIKDKIVDWLDPKPITYSDSRRRLLDFEEYLPDHK